MSSKQTLHDDKGVPQKEEISFAQEEPPLKRAKLATTPAKKEVPPSSSVEIKKPSQTKLPCFHCNLPAAHEQLKIQFGTEYQQVLSDEDWPHSAEVMSLLCGKCDSSKELLLAINRFLDTTFKGCWACGSSVLHEKKDELHFFCCPVGRDTIHHEDFPYYTEIEFDGDVIYKHDLASCFFCSACWGWERENDDNNNTISLEGLPLFCQSDGCDRFNSRRVNEYIGPLFASAMEKELYSVQAAAWSSDSSSDE